MQTSFKLALQTNQTLQSSMNMLEQGYMTYAVTWLHIAATACTGMTILAVTSRPNLQKGIAKGTAAIRTSVWLSVDSLGQETVCVYS